MQDGSLYLDDDEIKAVNIPSEYLQLEKSEQIKEIRRRMILYRPNPKEYRFHSKTVILADDGAATGPTIIAYARWVRKHQPKKLIIATCCSETC